MTRLIASMLLLFLVNMPANAVPFWGAKESSPADTAPAALKPGEFIWNPGVAPEGPMVVVVSITEQRAYVYRNGMEIGITTVSTGKKGHETPTGVFTILQKDKDHHSSIYNDAAMPYQERLTWGGVALHAGGLPGYPESHGCIHMPSKFAEELFGATNMGMTVVVGDDKSAPADVVHPAGLAPVDSSTGAPDVPAQLEGGYTMRWQPKKSPDGPVSMVVSGADRRMIVIRNGIEIGRTQIKFTDPDKSLGTHAFIVKAGKGSAESSILKGAEARNWMVVPMVGYGQVKEPDLSAVVGGRIQIPQTFLQRIYPLLVPGTTLVVTDEPVLEQNSGKQMTVMGAGNPNG
jgi:hypothetical protein